MYRHTLDLYKYLYIQYTLFKGCYRHKNSYIWLQLTELHCQQTLFFPLRLLLLCIPGDPLMSKHREDGTGSLMFPDAVSTEHAASVNGTFLIWLKPN